MGTHEPTAGASAEASAGASARARRVAQCRAWNAERAHQRQAGKGRAAQMTHAERVAAGNAAFLAFMVRFRAQIGQAPLPLAGVEQAIAKYLRPADIHAFGRPLHPQLAAMIYRAWCAGQLLNVEVWLDEEHELPPEPGGLWEVR